MKRLVSLTLAFACLGFAARPSQAQEPPEYPPFDQVVKGFEVVPGGPDGAPTMYRLWVRRKDNRVLAELPGDYMARKYFMALTVASGEPYAGLQAGDVMVYWRQYDKRLALMEPYIQTRSTGDPESQGSVRRLFTDRVIVDLPILTMGQLGGPVIDIGALLTGQAYVFFGGAVQVSAPHLAAIKTAKAFPQNVELAFEAPTEGGRLKTLHYSISVMPDGSGYQPRVADTRIGYFTTSYNDLGRFQNDGTWIRYINRWHLEKRDPSLKLSPPKNPITFYIEHATPVRYRQYVKQGILAWNAAFEKIGIRDAIEVRQQDAVTGEHMGVDPEDVRYNFVRWLSNDISTAIGPSRVHPLTGEILDADIILTDGWIRHFVGQHTDVLPQLAIEGFSPETLSWLDQNPRWDPRFLFANPSQRAQKLIERNRLVVHTGREQGHEGHDHGTPAFGGHALAKADNRLIGDDELDGLIGRTSQCNGMCLAAHAAAFDLGVLRMSLSLDDLIARGDTEGEVLDGMPEEFIGPLLAQLTAHEVGHTLGLRHNFKASSIYTLAEINSNKLKGKPLAGSVMDYLPVNIDMKDGEIQGDFAMAGVGPYDMWAIEYGYTFETDLKPILSRVAEPELRYATDEDTWGTDPLAKRYDFSSNPLDYAKSQMRLAQHHRQRVIDKFVKEGESWARARESYEMTLGLQMRGLSTMADWLGGAYVNRDKKGDKNGRPPVEVVSAQSQRDALKFVIDNAFFDEAFGLTPDLLRHMSLDQWLDAGGGLSFDEPVWPVHERIMAMQSSTLTMLINPTTLRGVLDNEYRTPADVDMVTLPELLDAVGAAIWAELDKPLPDGATARKPTVSSLRRNLQREHLDRLIDLTMPQSGMSAADKPISNLAMVRLRDLSTKIAKTMEQANILDPYTLAHLSEANVRITKALDAQYIYNIKDGMGGGGGYQIFFNQDGDQ